MEKLLHATACAVRKSTFLRVDPIIDLSNFRRSVSTCLIVILERFDQRISVSIVNRCIRSCSYTDSPLTFMRLIPLTLLHARNADSPGERRQRGGAWNSAYEDYVKIERITGQKVLDPRLLDRDWSTLRVGSCNRPYRSEDRRPALQFVVSLSKIIPGQFEASKYWKNARDNLRRRQRYLLRGGFSGCSKSAVKSVSSVCYFNSYLMTDCKLCLC